VGLVPIVASLLVGAAYLVATQALGIEEPGPFQGAPALALAVAGLVAEFVRRFTRLRFTTFVVTDERFYAITTFLTTDVRSVPFSRVSHVSLRRGLTGSLLGFWSARVGVTGGQEKGALRVPAIRDGERLLREVAEGQRRGADAAWLLRGD
jgi:uncharacterized membrane protein YdbT with pleckstrin-like domain